MIHKMNLWNDSFIAIKGEFYTPGNIDAYFAGTLVFIYPNVDLLNGSKNIPFLTRKKEQLAFEGNER